MSQLFILKLLLFIGHGSLYRNGQYSTPRWLSYVLVHLPARQLPYMYKYVQYPLPKGLFLDMQGSNVRLLWELVVVGLLLL